MAAGLLFPICECGALPVALRLIRKGVPLPSAAAYLFAAPLFNPLSILSTYLAFRTRQPWLMTGLRLGMGALLVGSLALWIRSRDSREILRLRPAAEGAALPADPEEPAWRARLRQTVRSVGEDLLSVAAFLALGAAVAAFLNTSINRAWLQPLAQNGFWGPVAAVLLAQLLSLCSTTDAFVIAALPQFTRAAALAFLVAGPIFDLKLWWIYQALFTRRAVLQIWLRVTAGALVLAWLYSLL